MVEAQQQESDLLQEITRWGRLSLITMMSAGTRTLVGHVYPTSEWMHARDPRITGNLDFNIYKHIKLRDPNDYRVSDPLVAMINNGITEMCMIGPVTKSRFEPEEYYDYGDREEVPVDAENKMRRWLERHGIVERKTILQPKRKTRKAHVGETPLTLGELCDYGENTPAYGLYYTNRIANPCDSDRRPRGDEVEILLPQELAQRAFSSVGNNPALIRLIVARMVTTVLDTSEARWLHMTPDSHGAFGIAYNEWKKKGRLYVHGPDAPDEFFEKYVREIPLKTE